MRRAEESACVLALEVTLRWASATQLSPDAQRGCYLAIRQDDIVGLKSARVVLVKAAHRLAGFEAPADLASRPRAG